MNGTIRRIDHLGRVVLPIEFRKTLRIREGDPLEITKNSEGISIKKYSPIDDAIKFAQSIVKNLHQITDKFCVVTDLDKAICVFPKTKAIVGRNITKHLISLLEERKSVVNLSKKGDKAIPVLEGVDLEYKNQIIVPIVSGGDCYGALIVLDNEKNLNGFNNDIDLIKLGAKVLAEQFNI